MASLSIRKNDNGREQVIHDGLLPGSRREPVPRVLASQAIKVPGREDDALTVGSSHLSRAQVEELRDRLSRWLETGSLAMEGEIVEPMRQPPGVSSDA